MTHENPVEKGGGEGGRRRKRRKEKELTEAQCDAGGGGGERSGGGIQGAEGSGDSVLIRKDSIVEEATADETKKKVKTKCWDVLPGLDGEGDGDSEHEDETVVPGRSSCKPPGSSAAGR